MINIHKNFLGGNISVKSIEGDVITLENELRDTTIDWFYWAFCVEGAEGREITFKMQETRLGYFGPAVSYDLEEWRWLDSTEDNSFTYKFREDESRVYFAHSMLYHPDRFYSLCEECGLSVQELCKSRKGRSVPCVTFGEGDFSIILTARHHACESTGSYVLEGVLRELITAPVPNAKVFCIPFVDFDGVIDGDQGKSRAPHDHNRDYTDEPIYPEVCAITKYIRENGCNLGFDFHSPWHMRGINDKIFIVRKSEENKAECDRFSKLFEAEITEDAMDYKKENDYPPNSGWNLPNPTFGFTMNTRPECRLAFTLESAYFGTPDNKVSDARLVELGRCFARALKKYRGN